MSTSTALESVDFPEHLSVTLANSLAAAFQSHFFAPRQTTPAPPLHSWADGATGHAEYFWTIELPPPDRRGAPGPGVPVNVHLIVTPADVKIEFTSSYALDEGRRADISRMADDIRAFVVSFLQFAKRSSLYFAVPTYPRSDAEKRTAARSGNDLLRAIFSGNSTNAFLLVLLFSLPAVLFLGYYALVLMVGAQLVLLFYSDRIALRVGSVAPSAGRPEGTVVGITIRPDPQRSGPIVLKVAPSALRAELQDAVAAAPGADVRAPVVRVLTKAGLPCTEDDVEVTTRDVYDLVAKAAQRFGLPVPKVVLTEVPISNAAATGISPRRSSMVITAGSLEELDDPQLEAVIGHELGHIRGRDPVILGATTAVLYLGAVFVWPAVLLYLGFAYFILALIIVYMLGKVLETRADSLSALLLGESRELATALTSIAFRELYGEQRSSSIRFLRWLTPDPHPPVYFRVKRLLSFVASGPPTGHLFLRSARDCLTSFFAALAGRQ